MLYVETTLTNKRDLKAMPNGIARGFREENQIPPSAHYDYTTS